MNIIIDNREHDFYEKIQPQANVYNLNISVEPLSIGDIILKNNDETLLIIERKTIKDLLASLKDGRYVEQCLRLQCDERCNVHQKIYLIEGNIQLHNQCEQQTIYSCITSLSMFKGFQIVRTLNIQESCTWLCMSSNKIQKSLKNGKKFYDGKTDDKTYTNVIKTCKKDNITPDNISQIMLMQIPGINASTSLHILNGFDSIYDLTTQLYENPKILTNKTYVHNGKERKINKKCIENVVYFLTHKSTDSINK